MLAALNGLSVARVPGREDSRHDAARVPIDERVSAGFRVCLAPCASRSQEGLFAQACRGCLTASFLQTEEGLVRVRCVKANPFQHLLSLHSGLHT